MGRPSLFTQELADAICKRLADGESLRSICREPEPVEPELEAEAEEVPQMPHEATVRGWARDNEAFFTQYARARDLGLDALADHALEVAATAVIAEKTVSKPTGMEVTTGDAVDRSRLHVDTLKWYLSKLAPKKYGDKITMDVNVKDDLAARLMAGRKRVRA